MRCLLKGLGILIACTFTLFAQPDYQTIKPSDTFTDVRTKINSNFTTTKSFLSSTNLINVLSSNLVIVIESNVYRLVGGSWTVLTNLYVGNNISVSNDLYIKRNGFVGNNLYIKNNCIVSNNLDLKKNLIFNSYYSKLVPGTWSSVNMLTNGNFDFDLSGWIQPGGGTPVTWVPQRALWTNVLNDVSGQVLYQNRYLTGSIPYRLVYTAELRGAGSQISTYITDSGSFWSNNAVHTVSGVYTDYYTVPVTKQYQITFSFWDTVGRSYIYLDTVKLNSVGSTNVPIQLTFSATNKNGIICYNNNKFIGTNGEMWVKTPAVTDEVSRAINIEYLNARPYLTTNSSPTMAVNTTWRFRTLRVTNLYVHGSQTNRCDIRPASSNVYSLGSSTRPWKYLYLKDGLVVNNNTIASPSGNRVKLENINRITSKYTNTQQVVFEGGVNVTNSVLLCNKYMQTSKILGFGEGLRYRYVTSYNVPSTYDEAYCLKGSIDCRIMYVWAGGFSYKSINSGTNWTSIPNEYGAMACSSNGAIVYAWDYVNGSATTIYKSVNTGATWTATGSITLPYSPFYGQWAYIASSYSGKNVGVALIDYYDYGTFALSTNYGVSWESIDGLYLGLFVKPRYVAISGNGTHVVFTDKDTTNLVKVVVKSSGLVVTRVGPIEKWRDVAISENGRYMAAIAEGKGIYVSSDYGTNWVLRYSYPYSDGLGDRIVMSPNADYIVTLYAFSDNFGLTWWPYNPGAGFDRNEHSLLYRKDKLFLYAVSMYDDDVYKLQYSDVTYTPAELYVYGGTNTPFSWRIGVDEPTGYISFQTIPAGQNTWTNKFVVLSDIEAYYSNRFNIGSTTNPFATVYSRGLNINKKTVLSSVGTNVTLSNVRIKDYWDYCGPVTQAVYNLQYFGWRPYKRELLTFVGRCNASTVTIDIVSCPSNAAWGTHITNGTFVLSSSLLKSTNWLSISIPANYLSGYKVRRRGSTCTNMHWTIERYDYR